MIAANRGFTLVELMVAMVMGLMVVAGVTQIFLLNQESHRVQKSQSELQERARFAAFQVSQVIARAGFRADPFEEEVETLSGSAIAGTDGSPDSISIRFESNGGDVDCAGTRLNEGDESLNMISLSANANADGRRDLECTAQRWDADGNLIATIGPVGLIRGVEALEIEYGLDLDDDGSVDRYQAAGAADLDKALSVRWGLLLSSDTEMRPKGGAEKVTLLGQTEEYGGESDLRGRWVIEKTVALRNRLE